MCQSENSNKKDLELSAPSLLMFIQIIFNNLVQLQLSLYLSKIKGKITDVQCKNELYMDYFSGVKIQSFPCAAEAKNHGSTMTNISST